jgi:Sec7-like guanine-nucleotide exchange factor
MSSYSSQLFSISLISLTTRVEQLSTDSRHSGTPKLFASSPHPASRLSQSSTPAIKDELDNSQVSSTRLPTSDRPLERKSSPSSAQQVKFEHLAFDWPRNSPQQTHSSKKQKTRYVEQTLRASQGLRSHDGFPFSSRFGSSGIEGPPIDINTQDRNAFMLNTQQFDALHPRYHIQQASLAMSIVSFCL